MKASYGAIFVARKGTLSRWLGWPLVYMYMEYQVTLVMSCHFDDEKTSLSCHFDDEKLVTQSMSMHISRTTHINVHAHMHLHIDVQGCPLSMKEYHQKVVAGVIPGTSD